MPLFGPNIKKMKEKGDIKGLVRALNNPKVRTEAVKALTELGCAEGLIKALNSDNAGVRIEVAETLKGMNDPEAIDALNKSLTNALKFGESEEQVEAITLVQGRAPEHFLSLALSGEPERVRALEKVGKKLNLQTFRDALLKVVERRKSGVSVWYALVALVELGDRSSEVLRELIEFSDAWIKTLDQFKGTQGIFAWALGRVVHEETLRALSYFRGNSIATDAIVKAYEERFLSSPRISGEKENAIYALAALGDPSTKERLEYLVSRGRVPEVALELYGKAIYDEIKAKVEPK